MRRFLSSGRSPARLGSQQELVQSLGLQGWIDTEKDGRLLEAFSVVDRGHFYFKEKGRMVDANKNDVYSLEFEPPAENDWERFPLGNPKDHVHELKLLMPWLQPGNSIFDCGCGSAYLTTVMGYLVAANEFGRVTGLERRPSLVDASIPRLANALLTNKWKLGANVLSRITIMNLDAVGELPTPQQPFHAIRVGFALPSADSPETKKLLRELRPGGRMISHLGEDDLLRIFDKDESGQVSVSISEQNSAYPPKPMIRRIAIEASSPEELEQAEAAEEARISLREDLKAKLEGWKQNFMRENGRRPTREDMAADSTAARLFAAFRKANNL